MTVPLQILHLEDNKNDAELVKEILSLEEDINFIVTNVDNKEDFLREISFNNFDLILADYSLPAFDGLSALKVAKEKGINAPFILVSAVLGEELAIEALQNGATDYVLKARLERLVPAIQRALREVEERQQRKRLESEIFDLEKVYHKIAERVRGFLKMDLPSGKYSMVDKFLEELSGYSSEEWNKNPNFIQQIVHPNYKDKYQEYFNSLINGQIPKMLEYKIIRKDGEERWWMQFSIGAFDRNQKLVSVSIVIVDNTDQKESYIKYQNLFENALVGMFRTDVNTGKIIEANETMTEIFGCETIDELKNFSAQEFYLSIHGREEFVKKMQNEKKLTDYKVQLKRKDGSKIWVSITGQIYVNEGFIEGVMIDISEEKKAQEELFNREQELERIFESTGNLTIIVEEDMIISKLNSQFERMLGYKKEEVEGKMRWTEFVHPDDVPWMVEYHKARRKEGVDVPINYEFRLIHKNGNVLNCYITVGMIPYTTKSVASVVDITQRKKAENALIRDRKASRLIAEAVVNSTDTNEFCKIVLEGIINILGFDSGSIRIIDHTKEELIPIAVHNLPENADNTLRRTSLKDTDFQLIRSLGEIIVITDALTDPKVKNLNNKYKYITYISWPIYNANKKLLGSIQIGSQKKIPISDDEKEFFEKLTELFSTSIERKLAEEEVKSQQQRRRLLENAINNSKEIILQGDENGIIFYVNSPVEEIFGYKPEELIGKSYSVLSPPGNEKKDHELLATAKESGKITFESVKRHKDGSLISVIMTLSSLIDKEDGTTTTNAIIVDTSDIKKLEASLRDRSYEFEVLNKVVSAGYMANNMDELLDFILNAILSSLDYTGGAIYFIDEEKEKAILKRSLGLSSTFTKNAKELAVKNKVFSKVFVNGKTIMAKNYMDVDKGHMKFGIGSLIVVPFLMKQKVIGGLLLSTKESREMTNDEIKFLEAIGRDAGIAIAKMNAELELIRSEQNLQIIFDALKSPFIAFDANTFQILKTNNAIQNKIGYNDKELEKITMLDIILEKDQIFLKKFLSTKSNGEIIKETLTFKTKKKDEVGIELRITKINLGNRKLVIAISPF